MNTQLDAKITKFLEDNRENFIDDLKGIVQIDSTSIDDGSGKPFGEGNAKAIDYMMNLCGKSGLDCRNIDYYCMDATYGSGKEIVASSPSSSRK